MSPIKKKLLLLAAALTISIVGCEIALRMVGLGRDMIYEHDELLMWKMAPNQKAWAPSYGMGYNINATGWRDDNLPIEKPPGEFRILALGDSVMLGQGVPQDETLVQRLENALRETDHLDAQVINSGVAGYNVYHYRNLLDTTGFDYEPDLILLGFVKNDIVSEHDIEGLREYTRQGQLFQMGTLGGFLRRHSAIFHALDGLRQRITARWKTTPRALRWADKGSTDDAWPYTISQLDHIAEAAGERGIPLVVVIFPFQQEAASEQVEASVTRLSQLQAQHGVHIVDLQETYAAHANEAIFLDPVHPSALGNGYAADAVLDYLREHQLVPDAPST